MTSRITFLAALLLAGCAHVETTGRAAVQGAPAKGRASAATPASVGVTARNSIVPVLDAHQHLMGPAAMSTLSREPSPPPVAVPFALTELLSAREHGVDDANYASLFSPHAQVFAEEQGRWWTGKARILDALGNFGTRHEFVPTSFAADGSAGYVAGVLRAKTGEDSHDFILGIRKHADGRWRIASEMKQPIAPPTYGTSPVTAEKVIEVLDDAGIRYATVLSTAYWFGDPDKELDEAARIAGTRAENDWVISQARRYPDRLIPFCGVNPLAHYAVAELERCAAMGVRGMKIHRNSKFRTSNPEHVKKLQQFFGASNQLGLAIVMHVRDMPDVLIDQILPYAPDVPIQIAHMGSDPRSLRLFANAIAARKPGTRNLWFDWTQALPIEDLWMYQRPGGRIGGPLNPGEQQQMVALMREVGLKRVLYGSDMPLPWNPTPRDWWRKTILTLPLTDDEIRDIANNVPPYVPH